jgi:hypothetical protein
VPDCVIIEKKGLHRPLPPAMLGKAVVELAADPAATQLSYRVTPEWSGIIDISAACKPARNRAAGGSCRELFGYAREINHSA